MTDTAAPSADAIAQAADLRAAGVAWEFIAKELGTTLVDVRRWPTRFPGPWRKAYARSRRLHLNDAVGEAVYTLRRQLRSEEEKSQREAAGWLIRYWSTSFRHRVKPVREKAPAAPPPATEQSTEARLRAIIENLTPRS